jgi:hypothetical protein
MMAKANPWARPKLAIIICYVILYNFLVIKLNYSHV